MQRVRRWRLALVVGLAGCGYANHEYREARFALAHVSEGDHE